MIKRLLLVSTLAMLFLQVAAAAEIDLEITNIESNDEFITNGELVLMVEVENLPDSLGGATDVEVIVTGEGVTGSSETTDLDVGESETIRVTISGFVWDKTRVWLEPSGESSDFDVSGDRIGIYMIPPKLDLEIIGPERGMKLVDFDEGGSLNVKVLVRNGGAARLFGVDLSITGQSDGLGCGVSGGNGQDIEAGKTGEYTMRCGNVSTGKQVRMRVEDENEAVFDLAAVEFTLIRPVAPPDIDTGLRLPNATINGTENGTDANGSVDGGAADGAGDDDGVGDSGSDGGSGASDDSGGTPEDPAEGSSGQTGSDGSDGGQDSGGREVVGSEQDEIVGMPRIVVSLLMIIVPLVILGIYAWMAISKSVPKKEKRETDYPIRQV